MQRLRTHWLALMGAILLLTLTVSAALGAPPEGNRGQTIASFVHELVTGDEETDEDEDQAEEDEEEGSEEEDLDETDEDLEDTEGDTEAAQREVPEEFANHGECVSQAAHDTEGFEESDAANKGEWVSDHARYICWGLEVPEEEEATGDETDGDLEEADADELSAQEQARADREAARAERRAAREAARAEREAARAEGATQSNARGGGNGKGKGGGKP